MLGLFTDLSLFIQTILYFKMRIEVKCNEEAMHGLLHLISVPPG